MREVLHVNWRRILNRFSHRSTFPASSFHSVNVIILPSSLPQPNPSSLSCKPRATWWLNAESSPRSATTPKPDKLIIFTLSVSTINDASSVRACFPLKILELMGEGGWMSINQTPNATISKQNEDIIPIKNPSKGWGSRSQRVVISLIPLSLSEYFTKSQK